MMKNLIKTIFIAGLSAIAFSSLAADWTITQTATITTPTPTLNQGNTTDVSNSIQSINGIALQTNLDSLSTGSSQMATIMDSNIFNLNQGPNVSGSSQSINYIESQNIGTGSGNPIAQTVTSTSTATTLTQLANDASNDANTQAMNIGKSAPTGDVNELTQGITVEGSLTLNQNDVVSQNNDQAVNYVFGAQIGANNSDQVLQSLAVTGITKLNQAASGGENVQSGNTIITSSTGRILDAEQTATVDNQIDVKQDMAEGNQNVQAVNFADTSANTSTGHVNKLEQSFLSNASNVNFLQTSGSGSTVNVQAGNFVDAGSNIVNLSQTFTANASAEVDFDQTGNGNTNTQAGNMARLNGGTASTISGITQLFTGSDGINNFNQDTNADNLIQSGNLIDIDQGALTDTSDTHQTFTTAGSVTMTQLGGGENNLQALSATVDKPGGSASSTLRQSFVVNPGAFSMAQNNVESSGQFANYAGETYQ